MADSWGLIIVLFFIFAIVFFVIKQFIEYPGLLNLQCIYSDDNVTGETLFENFQMDKLRDSVHSQKSNSHKKPSSSLPSSLSYSYRIGLRSIDIWNNYPKINFDNELRGLRH